MFYLLACSFKYNLIGTSFNSLYSYTNSMLYYGKIVTDEFDLKIKMYKKRPSSLNNWSSVKGRQFVRLRDFGLDRTFGITPSHVNRGYVTRGQSPSKYVTYV